MMLTTIILFLYYVHSGIKLKKLPLNNDNDLIVYVLGFVASFLMQLLCHYSMFAVIMLHSKLHIFIAVMENTT